MNYSVDESQSDYYGGPLPRSVFVLSLSISPTIFLLVFLDKNSLRKTLLRMP